MQPGTCALRNTTVLSKTKYRTREGLFAHVVDLEFLSCDTLGWLSDHYPNADLIATRDEPLENTDPAVRPHHVLTYLVLCPRIRPLPFSLSNWTAKLLLTTFTCSRWVILCIRSLSLRPPYHNKIICYTPPSTRAVSMVVMTAVTVGSKDCMSTILCTFTQRWCSDGFPQSKGGQIDDLNQSKPNEPRASKYPSVYPDLLLHGVHVPPPQRKAIIYLYK